MKKQVTRISILQSSKIVTVLYTLMGFLYTLIGIPMIIYGNPQIRIIGVIYALMPVILSVVGLLFFLIFAAIYNYLARRLGGFEFELKDIE